MSLAQIDPARGQRLRAMRKAKNLTQTEAARQLGCDAANLSRWERGGKISPTTLQKLCELYGVTVDSILTG